MSASSGLRVIALSLPALAYRAGVAARNAWYDRPGASIKGALPVISVGNLVAGGTGKTPLVAWLATRLAAEGRTPAVVSRGYGGTAGPGPILVSTGGGPRVDARVCGDEPHLLARLLRGVIVVVGSDRVEGVAAAAAAGASVVVLDDGFQHRRLARDCDVVLLDGRHPFDGGHLLPAGLLREPRSALKRASVVVLTRLAQGDRATSASDAVRATGFAGPIVRAGHRTLGFADATGAARETPQRAIAFCGIGDPELFRSDLAAAGVGIEEFRAFRDHHAYSRAAWAELRAGATRRGLPLVTTEKDLSRLESVTGGAWGGPPPLVLRIEATVWDEEPLLQAVRRAAPRTRRKPGR